MIPPLGKGLHDGKPAVSDFVRAFEQMAAGKKNELIFGFSEGRVAANNQSIAEYFARQNP